MSDGGAELVAGEALVDAVVLSGWLVVSKDQSTSTDHLLDTESIDDQRAVILRPLIPGPHAFAAHLRTYSICRIWTQIHNESGFGFTSKSNGLDSSVLSEVTSHCYSFVTLVILMSLPVSPANPRQNWIR